MPAPVLGKHRIQLQTGNKLSFFYLDAQNVATRNLVLVVKSDGADGYWQGKVTKMTGDVARCMVEHVPGAPPFLAARKKKTRKKHPVAGDLLLVDITITNHLIEEESDTIVDVPAAEDP